jgi:hypothetical protein
MTSSPSTDILDTLAVICAATGAISGLNIFYVVGTLSFTLSFGIRLGYDHRIEKYLQGIRDRQVRK